MVEVLSCILLLLDWELADSHMQHNLEKKDTIEIETVLESMNNDGANQGKTSQG
jgi:hypothetical protein